MLEVLKRERGHERQSAHNASQARPGTTSSTNTTSWTSSNPSPLSNANTNSSADGKGRGKGYEAALAHRNKLLTFQSENTQRSTVHDEASDLTDPYKGVNRWADPAERARQLRAQQAAMREQEERERPEWERRGKAGVLELSVGKGGKVMKTVRTGKAAGQVGGQVGGQGGLRKDDGVKGKAVESSPTVAAEGVNGEEGKEKERSKNAPDLRRPLWTPHPSVPEEQRSTAEERAIQTKVSNLKIWKPGDRDGKWDDNESIILNGGAYGSAVAEEERGVGTEEGCG